MPMIAYDVDADQRGVISRLAQQVRDRSREFLDSTEQAWIQFDANGKGFWLGVRSARARHLFDTIHRHVCRGFDPHAQHSNDGVAWVRFGY
jgi:hypothetical protein